MNQNFSFLIGNFAKNSSSNKLEMATLIIKIVMGSNELNRGLASSIILKCKPIDVDMPSNMFRKASKRMTFFVHE